MGSLRPALVGWPHLVDTPLFLQILLARHSLGSIVLSLFSSVERLDNIRYQRSSRCIPTPCRCYSLLPVYWLRVHHHMGGGDVKHLPLWTLLQDCRPAPSLAHTLLVEYFEPFIGMYNVPSWRNWKYCPLWSSLCLPRVAWVTRFLSRLVLLGFVLFPPCQRTFVVSLA